MWEEIKKRARLKDYSDSRGAFGPMTYHQVGKKLESKSDEETRYVIDLSSDWSHAMVAVITSIFEPTKFYKIPLEDIKYKETGYVTGENDAGKS